MKKTSFLEVFLFCITIISVNAFGGNNATQSGWRHDFSSEKMFIKNNGQYTGINGVDGDALFGVDNSQEQIIFTNSGVNYVYFFQNKAVKNPLKINETENEDEEKYESTLK